MSRSLFLILLLTWLISGSTKAASRKPELVVSLDKMQTLVGESITLKIEVKAAEKSSVNWQPLEAALADAIMLQTKTSQRETSGEWIIEKEVIFTSVDSGALEIGSFPVTVTSETGTDTLLATALNLNFLPEKRITALQDIKPQAAADLAFFRHPMVYLPATFFLLAFTGLWFLGQRLKKQQLSKEIPAREKMLKKLELLENNLAQQAIPRIEVSRELAAIWQASLENGMVDGRKTPSKTVGEMAEKLGRLQFGPGADKLSLEKSLIREMKAILAKQEVKQEGR